MFEEALKRFKCVQGMIANIECVLRSLGGMGRVY
jgi:hypothetical protein